MQLKSKIQHIQEQIVKKHQFVEGLECIMDKYTIEDSVFKNGNGKVLEVCKGYFEVVNEYDTLTEAIKYMDNNEHAIRIMENKKFQIGKVHQFISECESGQIFDLEAI